MVNGRVHEFTHIDFNQHHGTSDVDSVDAEFVVGMKVEMRTGMFDDVWVVGSGLPAVILTIVNDFVNLVFFVFDIDCKSESALLTISSQDTEFGLEGLLN